MKRTIRTALAIAAATLLGFFTAIPATAATFQTSGEINVSQIGSTAVVTLTGAVAKDAATLIQFRADQTKWTEQVPFVNGVAKFDQAKGNTFQLLAADDKWLLLTPEMFGNPHGELKFVGCVPDNTNPGGFKLRVQ